MVKHTKAELKKMTNPALKELVKEYKISGRSKLKTKDKLIAAILKHEKKLKKKSTAQVAERVESRSKKSKTGKLRCKGLRKTKDPKCDDQLHCEWKHGKCQDLVDVDELAGEMEEMEIEPPKITRLGIEELGVQKPKSKKKPSKKPRTGGPVRYTRAQLTGMNYSKLKKVGRKGDRGPCGALQDAVGGAKKLKKLLGKTCSKLTKSDIAKLIEEMAKAGLIEDDEGDRSDTDEDSDSEDSGEGTDDEDDEAAYLAAVDAEDRAREEELGEENFLQRMTRLGFDADLLHMESERQEILHAIDAHKGGVLESDHFIEDSRTLSQLQAALEEMLRVSSDLDVDVDVVPGFLVSDSDEDSDDEAARQVILHDLARKDPEQYASDGGHIASDVPIEDPRTLEELRGLSAFLESQDELQRVPLVSDSDEGTDDEDDDPLDDPFELEPVESDDESGTDSEPEEDEDEEVKDEDEAAAISNAQIRVLVRKCLLGENFGSSDDSSDGGNEDSGEDSDVSEDDEDGDEPFEFSFDDDDDEYFSFHEEDEMIV
jgi:hypothetical protein